VSPSHCLQLRLIPDHPHHRNAKATRALLRLCPPLCNLTLAETPEPVLAAFEKVLAETTSFAVAEATATPFAPAVPTPTPAAAPALAQTEQVSAASGQTFATTPATASKIRSAGVAVAASLHQVGEHVGSGIVYAGEWYRKRVGDSRADVKMSDATLARCDSVASWRLFLKCSTLAPVPRQYTGAPEDARLETCRRVLLCIDEVPNSMFTAF
jgi:hypothetical protein